MTTLHIKKSRLGGEIAIPSSKSHALRALLFALMARKKSVIRNYLHAQDSTAMLQAITQFGARTTLCGDVLEVEGVGGELRAAEDVVHAGNSGIVLRFIGALAALLPTYTVITGDDSIRHRRPVKPLLCALQQLGAFAVSSRQDDHAPLIVRGPITKNAAELSGEDSQPVSALLIACSFLPQTTTLTVTSPGEKPWIDLTLHYLNRFGIRVIHESYERYTLFGHGAFDGFEMTLPGDWSSAAYPIAAALVTDSELTVHNVDINDKQGDKHFIDILRQMGARIDIDSANKCLTVRQGAVLKGIKVDINACIDMVTLLPVVACFAEGETLIVNAEIARFKESDRIRAMVAELKKMGAVIEETPQGMRIQRSKLFGARVFSHRDHRVALALSIAGLGASGDSFVEGAECIAKGYPTFPSDLNAIGAQIG